MSDVAVIDSSVLLAYLLGEAWGTAFEPPVQLLGRSLMSSVNFTEVITRLVDLHLIDAPYVSESLEKLHIVPFTPRQSRIAGEIRAATRSSGLSLGDRACIALAMDLGLEVYTADRPWLKARLPIPIHLIR